jgi:hypothetical protein
MCEYPHSIFLDNTIEVKEIAADKPQSKQIGEHNAFGIVFFCRRRLYAWILEECC